MGAPLPGAEMLGPVVHRFEQVVMLVLVLFLMVITSVCTVELGILLGQDLTEGTLLPLDVEDTFELFGFLLLIVVGLELLSTLKSYLLSRVFYTEVVIEVALIAVAQKIIVMDLSRADGFTLLGLAGLFGALVGAFWVVRTARTRYGREAEIE
jgi:uncharacterized membrane protein (DUF373 family)